MEKWLHVLVQIALGLTFASILGLAGCLTDQPDDRRSLKDSPSVAAQPASTPRPNPTPTTQPAPTPTTQPTPTPDASFEPSVGMLAAVPIGRMLVQCWKKEGKVNNRSFLTVSCEAADAYRELYIEAWVNPEEPGANREVKVSLIYFEKIGSDQVDYMQCEDIALSRGITTKERGELLSGTCDRHLHSYQDASLLVQKAVGRWTTHSGLAEATTRDYIDPILNQLKR